MNFKKHISVSEVIDVPDNRTQSRKTVKSQRKFHKTPNSRVQNEKTYEDHSISIENNMLKNSRDTDVIGNKYKQNRKSLHHIKCISDVSNIC